MYPCNHFTDSFSGIHDLPMAWIAGFAGLLRGPKWHSGAFVGSSEICSCVFVFSKWLEVEAGSWVFKQKKYCIVYSIHIYIYKHIIKILSDSKTSRKNFSGNSKAHYEIHIMTYWSPHFSWVFFIPEMLVTQTKQFSCHGLDRGLGRLEVSLYCLAPGR